MERLRLPRCVSRFDKNCQKVKDVYKGLLLMIFLSSQSQ